MKEWDWMSLDNGNLRLYKTDERELEYVCVSVEDFEKYHWLGLTWEEVKELAEIPF